MHMFRFLVIALLSLVCVCDKVSAVYSPATGRWLERDPAGFVDGMSLYQYGMSGPVLGSDPFGLRWDDVPGYNRGQHGTWHHYYKEEGYYFLGFVPTGIVTETQVPSLTSFTPDNDPDGLDNKGRNAYTRNIQGSLNDASTTVQGAACAAGNGVVFAAGMIIPGPEDIIIAGLLAKYGGKAVVKAGEEIFVTTEKGIKKAITAEEAAAVRKLVEEGKAVEAAAKIPESRLGHIFSSEAGHLADTPANRQLLIDTASNPKYLLGNDKWGNTWSGHTLEDGTQIWTSSRNGEIANGGVNQVPRSFNPDTGLSSPNKPQQKTP